MSKTIQVFIKDEQTEINIKTLSLIRECVSKYINRSGYKFDFVFVNDKNFKKIKRECPRITNLPAMKCGDKYFNTWAEFMSLTKYLFALVRKANINCDSVMAESQFKESMNVWARNPDNEVDDEPKDPDYGSRMAEIIDKRKGRSIIGDCIEVTHEAKPKIARQEHQQSNNAPRRSVSAPRPVVEDEDDIISAISDSNMSDQDKKMMMANAYK